MRTQAERRWNDALVFPRRITFVVNALKNPVPLIAGKIEKFDPQVGIVE